MVAGQISLFGHDEPSFDPQLRALRRTALAQGAYVDFAPGFLSGHARLFDELLEATRWRSAEEPMYDRIVAVPRLLASVPDDGPGHPILAALQRALGERYGEVFARVSMALYRDGRDSVAFHGDRIARRMPNALVATLSLGGTRRFLLRPYGGGRSIGFRLSSGDLIVMGGSCQRTWQHAIPKQAHADPRIAVMFRPIWRDPKPL